MNGGPKKKVAICESQPVTAEGLRSLISRSPDLEFLPAVDSLPAALDLVQTSAPAVLILDKAFGAQAVLECLAALKNSGSRTASVVWGISITEAEALRFVQAGAKGVIRKSTDLEALLICLHSVASGATWMEQDVFCEHPRRIRESGPELTPRERQVVELVGQGLKNREIGSELGIRPGTVKVHLKHIFEKTGVRGRFGLALSGLKGKAPRNSHP
jgi:two-component system nitrate/nitrite response regulator NarL